MSNYTIICVDDEKIITDSLKSQLSNILSAEFEIETAESGEEALVLIDELKEDGVEIPLIISDYMMPRLKGDDLLIEVHKNYPETIKILLTGQATIDGVKRSINKANLYRFINKPWVKEDIELAVNEAIKSYITQKQIEKQNKELLQWVDSFIETMCATLDTRDTTTAGHSKRLAEYCVKLARAINSVEYGIYKNFSFTEDEINELYFSALLHDIGKIVVRENILLKEERLSNERQLAIEYRFGCIKTMLQLKETRESLCDQEEYLLRNIDDYLEFVLKICKREYITEEEIEIIKKIANTTYVDIRGIEKNLLDSFEKENLLVLRGNLTNEERSLVNSHAEHTYNILKGLPWPENLKNVPIIAASHHEKLNGTGYFKGLTSDEISVQSRILSMLDIYEALTSASRPYKPAKTHEEAINIIREEVDEGKLDRGIFKVFSSLDEFRLL